MTDDVTSTPAPDREPPPSTAAGATPAGRRSSADVAPHRPAYKGQELDAARGPGLGCFWFQVAVLAVFLVLIPVGVTLDWPFEVLAALLFIALGLLLFVGQTLIFLLRIVAADRRDTGRRRPLASPTPTVGQLEDALGPDPAESTESATEGPPAAPPQSPAPPAGEPGSDGVRE